MSAPMSMMGTGLQLLARTCMGKMTYRSALTLKEVLPMLVSPRTANHAGGMVLGFLAREYLPTKAMTMYRRDVTKRKLSSCSLLPPQVAYSSNRPFATKLPMIPKKHRGSHRMSDSFDLCCLSSASSSSLLMAPWMTAMGGGWSRGRQASHMSTSSESAWSGQSPCCRLHCCRRRGCHWRQCRRRHHGCISEVLSPEDT
jgi:hypothetical protein